MNIADKMLQLKQDIDDVYQAGYDKGVAEGGGSGDGWYDILWDAIQNDGKRTDYSSAFNSAIQKWNKSNFKPKYDMKPTNASQMFWYSFRNEEADLVELLKEARVSLDLSNSTNNQNIFYQSGVTHLGVIDCSCAMASANGVFRGAKLLRKVDKWILRDDGTNTFNIAFHTAYVLEEITEIVGVIGENIGVEGCPLNKLTFTNIFKALSIEVTGKTLTVSKNRVNNAFETAEGLADGSTSAEWLALVATKPNWTISLA